MAKRVFARGKWRISFLSTVSPGRRRIPTFRALEHRNFRVFWTGLTISAVGTWMQIVAQSLLVLELTHGSAASLGMVSLLQALSFLLVTPLGGSLADRFDQRRLLLVTQSLMMGFAGLLGLLTATGVIRFWMILFLAFASSATLSFDQPARNALIASLVPKEDLMNAISLQSAVFNGASILGPVLAGLTLSRIGYSGSFFLNAASFSAVLAALLLLRTSGVPGAAGEGRRLLYSVREALQFVRRDTMLPSVILAYGALLFFGPSAALVLPLFAKQVLHIGPAQLGMLFSVVGGGTVLSALMVASLGDFGNKRQLLFGAILVWTVALSLFALSGSLYIAVPALLLWGAAQNVAGTTSITLLQTRVPPEMRGRAMSLNTLLIMGVRPLGDFLVGAVIGLLGFRPAVVLSASIVGLALLTLSVARPTVRSP